MSGLDTACAEEGAPKAGGRCLCFRVAVVVLNVGSRQAEACAIACSIQPAPANGAAAQRVRCCLAVMAGKGEGRRAAWHHSRRPLLRQESFGGGGSRSGGGASGSQRSEAAHCSDDDSHDVGAQSAASGPVEELPNKQASRPGRTPAHSCFRISVVLFHSASCAVRLQGAKLGQDSGVGRDMGVGLCLAGQRVTCKGMCSGTGRWAVCWNRVRKRKKERPGRLNSFQQQPPEEPGEAWGLCCAGRPAVGPPACSCSSSSAAAFVPACTWQRVQNATSSVNPSSASLCLCTAAKRNTALTECG